MYKHIQIIKQNTVYIYIYMYDGRLCMIMAKATLNSIIEGIERNERFKRIE